MQSSQQKGDKQSDEKPITKNQKIDHAPGTDIQIEPKPVIGEPNSKNFCCKFNSDDKYLACASEIGEIRVYNTKNSKLSYVFYSSKPNIPFSYIRWRPQQTSNKTKNVFVTINTDGEIQHFHLASGKCLSTIKEESFDPQLYCLDYCTDGSKFGVCGSDPNLKIYDEETRKKTCKLGGEELFPPGHSLRVYCIKWDKEDPNKIYTGGWDYRVITWDLRAGKPVSDIYEPLICGDGIDLFQNYILTSSCTATNQLRIWDARNCKLVSNIDWDSGIKNSSTTEPVFLYAGQFSKTDGTLILAGGSNSNEVKLFDRENQNKGFCLISDLCREIYSVDFANKGDMFAVTGGDGYVRMFTMNITA